MSIKPYRPTASYCCDASWNAHNRARQATKGQMPLHLFQYRDGIEKIVVFQCHNIILKKCLGGINQ